MIAFVQTPEYGAGMAVNGTDDHTKGRAMEGLMPLLIASAVVCGALGAIIGTGKNATAEGLLLGALFGPLGLLAAFALDNREACRRCGTRLNGTPEICPNCGSETALNVESPLPHRDAASEAAEADYIRRVRAKRHSGQERQR